MQSSKQEAPRTCNIFRILEQEAFRKGLKKKRQFF